MDKNYYIGLDMGTESVGWAVTDRDYNLVKRAETISGEYIFRRGSYRRGKESFPRRGRRRIARTRHRLMLLQELFDREISAKDFGFFRRLENSRYLSEDKAEEARGKYLLFNDEDFNDKDFYKKYPTVFHLRSSLISEEIKDVRLLYLAIHHIIKNRGHFLFEGQNFEVGDTQRATEEFPEFEPVFGGIRRSYFSGRKLGRDFRISVRQRHGKVRKKRKNPCIDAQSKGQNFSQCRVCNGRLGIFS